ncbi:MAG: hypothetical protein P8074_10335 [Anaerolineales bacterium]
MIDHKSKPGLLAIFVLIVITISACTLPMRGGENATVPAPSATQPAAETASAPEKIPATVTEVLQPETATATPTPLLASGSPVPTKTEPAHTPTRAITRPTQESPTHTPTPERSPEPVTAAVAEIRYVVQSGTPVVMANFVKPDLGCNFSGIGGQVFGRDQAPVNGLVVEVNGPIDGEQTTLVSLTGTELSFGPGGYLVQLSDKPFASQEELTIQLFDLTGKPESEKIPFDTSLRCDENLVLMNFVQISPPDIYLPFLFLDGKPQSPRP